MAPGFDSEWNAGISIFSSREQILVTSLGFGYG
jgi:hypothetical protein